MIRTNRLFTILLLVALLLSACQPIQLPAPSAAPSLPDILSGFVENNGVRIHYEIEGQGPPLVLVHWWTGSIADWRLFGYVDALKESYRLILIDARGHGQSDKPHDPAAYILERQVGDIVAVLDKLGIDKAHYFGYSMGGTIGWAVAKYAPERLLSLIIGGEAPENYDPVDDIAGISELGAEGWGHMVADLCGSYGFQQPEIYTVYAATDIDAVVADVTTFSAENFANDLSNMTTPILLLAGTEDTDHAALAAAAKQLPQATFVSLPGFDHTAAFLQTNLVLEQVTQFLAKFVKTALDDTTVAKIEGIVQKAMMEYPAPGIAMCIVKDGQVVYSKGFGFADVAGKRSVTSQSLLIQASITKSLVAMAIMKLAEQGKIDLDEPVTTYLPYFTMKDEGYKKITVRMLLSHRAGLPNSPDFWVEPLDATLNPLEQAVRDLAEMQLLFAPGTDWNYSSYGYSALGAIIAQVTGKPFERYMQEEWLEPIGMTHSTFVATDVEPTLRMTLYGSDQNGNATPTELACDGRDASTCNLWSSCEDMVKWAQLMLNHGEQNGTRFLKPESIKTMWTPVSNTPWLDALGLWYGSPIAEYGLGWYIGEMEGHRLVGHAGGTEGANTQIQLAPDDGLAVVAMDNWLDLETVTGYPASFATFDVMYTLLGIEPE